MLQSRQVGLSVVKAQCPRRRLMDRAGNTVLEVVYPEGDKLRARRVVSRSRARPTGKYPSWKMQRMVQWESHNELNAYRLLDATPDVKAYHEQPIMLRYVLDGEEHRHYPDVLVEYRNSRELWEIKPTSQALDPWYVARTRFLQATLPELGFNYRMVLAEELAMQPRLNTVLTLLKHGRTPVSDLIREQVRRYFNAVDSVTWSHAAIIEVEAAGRDVFARLLLEGDLSCDMDQALEPTTPLWLANAQAKDGGRT